MSKRRFILYVLAPAVAALLALAGPSPAPGGVASAEPDLTPDEVGLTAQANTAEDDGAPYLSWILGGLLVVVVLASIGNAVWKSPADHLLGFLAAASEGPVADHLFLHCDYEVVSAGGERHVATSYIRNLSTRGATLLVESELPRGSELRLRVGELPGYPERGATIAARVRRVRRVDPDARAWLAQIQFLRDPNSDRRTRRELGGFVHHLIHKPYGVPVS